MATRALIVFEHENPLGNAHAHDLQNRIKVNKNNPDKPIRSYNDYSLRIDDENLPSGIKINQII